MSGISTHILDTALGLPAAGVAVSLQFLDPASSELDAWLPCASALTDADGRCQQLLAPARVEAGRYRLTFATAAYFARDARPTLYPEITITFEVTSAHSSYHIPLLLNPFGYTTYRGS